MRSQPAQNRIPLKPCPLCGGIAQLKPFYPFENSEWFRVECDGECLLECPQHGTTRELAAAIWNSRRIIPPCLCGGQAVLCIGEQFERPGDGDGSRRVILCQACGRRAEFGPGERGDYTGIEMSDAAVERWVELQRKGAR
jgi:hypothetical protein